MELLVVFLQVCDVFDDLLEDVVGRLGGMVLESGTLAAEQLDLFLVVIEHLDCLFCVPLEGGEWGWGVDLRRDR